MNSPVAAVTFVLGLTLTGESVAQPIITTNGLPTTSSAVCPAQLMAQTFTLGGDYTNVDISAALTGGEPFAGTAFLMNQIGPGTTVANELASATFTFAVVPDSTTLVDVPLFSGLALDAGTYYLVFDAPSSPCNTGISRSASATYTTAPGVSVGLPAYSNPPQIDNAYSPRSTFTNTPFIGKLFFTVSSSTILFRTGSNPATSPGGRRFRATARISASARRRPWPAQPPVCKRSSTT